jgi:hypothetical protein
MRRERTCLSINRARYYDQLSRQPGERSWPFPMSEVSIMSTGARLDFSVGRTTRPIERRVSAQAMLCPRSRVIISIRGIYVARVIDASTEISDACRGPLFW